jgi:hypothetical protein
VGSDNVGNVGNLGNVGNEEASDQPPGPKRLTPVKPLPPPSSRGGPLRTKAAARSHSRTESAPARLHTSAIGSTTTGHRAAATAARHRRAAAAGRGRGVRVNEIPLVVVGAALVDPDRRFLALADDAEDPAASHLGRDAAPSRLRRHRLGLDAPPSDPSSGLGTSGLRTSALGASGLLRQVDARKERLKLAVLGHRILVFLPEKLLLDENVERRRPRARAHFHLPEPDRPHVLLATEHQFRFLFALRLLPPGWQRRGHEDGHHGEADQQRRHRVAVFPVLTL